MSQIHIHRLKVGETEFCLVKYGTGPNGMGLRKMFDIAESEWRGKGFSFASENEYKILVPEMKSFPDGWKNFVSGIVFSKSQESNSYNYGSVRCIQWCGKGKGRRWKEAGWRLTDVVANPGCIIFRKRS